jgi:hypothetical protein
MKKGIFGLVIIAAFSLAGCNNYFHELMPPDGNRIISFSVQGQIDTAVISDNSVDAMVDNESPLSSLIPQITVSDKASLLPLTYEYLQIAFPGADILNEAAALYEARDITEYVMDLIRRTPGFSVPPLDIPIDFTGPVSFLVVSGQGVIRQYTVYVVKDTGEPRILGFGISKYDNPELIRDAAVYIDERAKTIQAAVLYPMEMDVSYAFVPSFQIMGERLEVDGAQVRSGMDAIRFNRTPGTQDKILTVWRNGRSINYTLTLAVTEDPDSVRSIIDFRFYKADNPGIAATAVGSIYNNDHLGTIDVQVFYSGARPSVLTPSFLSPGTVSVEGLTQYSAINAHDFSQPIEYRVVSRNNRYVRTYIVRVDFIDIVSAAPQFTSFKFSSGVNHELVQDTEAQISNSAGLIMLTARYGGAFAPDMLIPEFRATGIVTVYGSVQTSGFSAQYFTSQIRYTVTNPENSLLTRDYWVQVTFIHDTSAAASINSFGFRPDENPGLADELTGRIDQNAGTITVFAPVGSGVTSRTMFPHFRAAGQALVNGDVQISGTSGMLFDTPVVYEVVSANGINRKTYTVTVRELQSTIYVNQNAYGVGDGANWTDAFRNLHDACEAASLFPADVPKEIWIAAGTYKPSGAGNSEEYLLLTANTSYIGGFAGYETAKSQRSIAANKVVVSGELGSGKYSNSLFGSFNGSAASTVNGHLSFENIEFTSARAVGSGDRANGGAINARLAGGYEMSVRNCSFNDLRANNGGTIYVNGGELVISAVDFENITAVDSGAYGANLSRVEIDGIKLRTISNTGFYFSDCLGDIEINNAELRDISGDGIYIQGGGGSREFSNITGNGISGTYGLYVSGGGGVTLTNSNFDTCGQVCVSSGSSPVRITGVEIKNVSGSDGLYASGGNTVIENTAVRNVTNGTGMNIVNNGSVRISGSTINGVKAPNGRGLSLKGSGSAMISNTLIENIEADYISGVNHANGGAIIADMAGDLTIMDSTINAITSGRVINLTGSGNTIISNTAIKNINTGDDGYVILASGRRLVIAGTTMNNITAGGGGVYGSYLSGVAISDLALRDIYSGLSFSDCNGDIEIKNVNLQNISNNGIYISGGSGRRELSRITGNRIGRSAVQFNTRSNDCTLADSNFDTCEAGISCLGANSLRVSGTVIKNVSSFGVVVYYSSYTNNIVIEDVRVENVTEGNGMSIWTYNGTAQVLRCNIKNINGISGSDNGKGIYFSGESLTVSGTTIEDVKSFGVGGGIKLDEGSLYVYNSVIKNTSAGDGAGIGSSTNSGTIQLSGVEFRDLAVSWRGGAIAIWGHNVSISYCHFTNTQSPEGAGGAIWFSNSNVSVNNCTFTNTRGTAGGAATFLSCPVAIVMDCTFNNTATVTGNTGNAIWFSDCTSRTQTGNTFTAVPSPTVVTN